MPHKNNGRTPLNRRTVLKGAGTVAAAGLFGTGNALAADADTEFGNLCEAVPQDTMLVLDRSGSMFGSKLQAAKNGATEFIDRLTTNDRCGLVSFANDVTLDEGLTDDFDAAKTSVDSLNAGGGTDVGGGVQAARDELNNNGRSDATPVMVVLSNGLDNYGADPIAAADAAKNDGIRLITIAYGGTAAEDQLEAMASEPKDENAFVADQDDISDIFETITQEICPTTIEIDIKPGSDPNSINPKNRGNVPVAIHTTDDFDAGTVDPASLRFGSPATVIEGDGATLAHDDGHEEDVDDDGDDDHVGHYPTQATGFASGDEEGWLVGETVDGEPIAGRDSVRIVGPKR